MGEAEWNETVLKTHNSHRSRAGLPEFQWNEALAGIARDWLQSDTMSLHCDKSLSLTALRTFAQNTQHRPFIILERLPFRRSYLLKKFGTQLN